MKVSKAIRIEDLGTEFQRLDEIIEEASNPMPDMPSLVDSAREFCPSATGALGDSIRSERRGKFSAALIAGGGGYINPRTGKGVDYARPVHDGTSSTMPRPFLLQAVVQERLNLAKEMARRTAEAF